MMRNVIKKNIIHLILALFLIIAASGAASADDAYTYADEVSTMVPTANGDPNHAPSMNMNWLNSPPCPPFQNTPMYEGEPFTNPDRLTGLPDGWAVGWGPGAGSVPWTGAANVIVKTAVPFTHDGIIAANGEDVSCMIGDPDNYNVSETREGLLADMGYDVVIYGLGYGFDGGFESHGQIRVWVAEELSSDINDWSLVSSWTGDPNGTEGEDYFENRDGTTFYGTAFGNGGYGGMPRTYMAIDLDNPDMIDPATGENMNLAAFTGTYNYIWFEGGAIVEGDDPEMTHGNANFLDAFAAHPAPVAIPTFSPEPGTYTAAQDVSIICDTEDVVIYYTTDGTEPSENSDVYNNPVSITSTTTLKAKAFKAGWGPSETATGLYTITGTIAAPVFSPVSGTTFIETLEVEISCATEDAVIYYTLNESEPTEESTKYIGQITITETTTLKARAFKDGWNPSAVGAAEYTKTGTVAVPAFSPVSGTYVAAQGVSIICDTANAVIYYTTDGTEPSENSDVYNNPVSITSTTTLKAKAFKDGWGPSETAEGLYTITGTVAVPTFLPVSGTTFIETLEVEISCATEDAVIYYTQNGSEPTEASIEYTCPITITETTTFKARAFKDGWDPSEIATSVYTLENTAPITEDGELVTCKNQAATGTLAASDANNDVLTYSIVTIPAHGLAEILDENTGSYQYEPETDYIGEDTFTFKANDGQIDSNIATITITVSSEHTVVFSYADNVVDMSPTPIGEPNHAPSMNMNWLNDPGNSYTSPNPFNDRLLGAYDQYAVGWGPAGDPWTGTADVIVRMKKPFTSDGVVATGSNPDYMLTDEKVLSGMGYDLIIYGLGYGFNGGFESHGQIRVWIAKELSDNINDWTLVSSWSGNPKGDEGVDYWENLDGTLMHGVPFNNGGFSAWSHTFMTIDLDNPKIIDPETGELKDIEPVTGEYSYIWFEGGSSPDDPGTHGNANFLDAFAAYSSDQTPDPGSGENHSPMADASDDQTVYPNYNVILDASGTKDIDGDKLRWEWRQTAGTEVILSNDGEVWAVDLDTFSKAFGSKSGDPEWNPDADYNGDNVVGPEDFGIFKKMINPTFTAPGVGPEGETLKFELTVSDDEFVVTDTVTINIMYNVIASSVFAMSVINQQDCISMNLGIADEGLNALGAPDYETGGDCSGWNSDNGSLTLKFDLCVADGGGDDLIIYYSGQGKAEVSVSRDGEAWAFPAILPDVEEGDSALHEISYNISDFGFTDICYVKIEKIEGTQGVFIDAVEGLYVRATPVHAAFVKSEMNCVIMGPFTDDWGEHAVGKPDGDYSGWIQGASGHLTLGFDAPLADGLGNDLSIYWNGWGKVFVSVSKDGADWTQIGGSPEGDNVARTISYDFKDIYATSVRYVKIDKETGGMGVIYIDAVKGHYGICRPVDPAGKDQTVKEGSRVTLGDLSNTSSSAYKWVQVENEAPLVVLSADNAPNPTFIAPMMDDRMIANEDAILKFKLFVDNNDIPFQTGVTVIDNGIGDISDDAQFTFNNLISGANMGISCNSGEITGYDIINPDTAHNVDVNNSPDNLIYGLISFEAQVAAGDTTAVIIYLPAPAPANYAWYKYNAANGWFDFSREIISDGTGDGAVFSDDRMQVSLYITDNGDYDDDEREGVIKDPSGLGELPGIIQPTGNEGNSGGGGSSGGGGLCFISTSAYGSNLFTSVYLLFVVFAISGIMTGIRFRIKR